jgi:ribonuclease D
MTIFFYENDLPDSFIAGDAVAIDSETMGLNIKRDRLCLVQFSNGDGNAFLVRFNNNYNCPNIKKILTNHDVQKIFHFARFDLACLKYYLKCDINNIYCTKIASRLVRTYTESHGLKSICEELLGIEISKKQQSSDWGAVIISDKQQEYAASDVLYLHSLRDKLTAMLEREKRLIYFQQCLQFLATRVDLDLQGFENIDIFAH